MKRLKSICSLFMIMVVLLSTIQLPDFAVGEKYAIYEKYNYFDYTIVQKETQIFPEVYQHNLSANPSAFTSYYANYDNIVGTGVKDLTAWFAAIPAVSTGQKGDNPITYNSSAMYFIQHNPDYFVNIAVSISTVTRYVGPPDEREPEYTYTKSFTCTTYNLDRTLKRQSALAGTFIAQEGIYPDNGVATGKPEGNYWYVKTATPLQTPTLTDKTGTKAVTINSNSFTPTLSMKDTYIGKNYTIKYKVLNTAGQLVTPYEVIDQNGTINASDQTINANVNFQAIPNGNYKVHIWSVNGYNLESNQEIYDLTVTKPFNLVNTNPNTQQTGTMLPIKLNYTDANPVCNYSVKYNVQTLNRQLVSDSEITLMNGTTNGGVVSIDKVIDMSAYANGDYLVNLWITNGYNFKTNEIGYTVKIDKAFTIKSFIKSDLSINAKNALMKTTITNNNNIGELVTAKYSIINTITGAVAGSGNFGSVAMTELNKTNAPISGSIPFASIPNGSYKLQYWVEAPNRKSNEESVTLIVGDTTLQTMAVPIINAPTMSSAGELSIRFSPLNAAFKAFKVIINDKEVDSRGLPVAAGQGHWFSLGTVDTYILSGLNVNQTYTVKVKGRYSDNEETDFSTLHTVRGIGNEPSALTGIKVVPNTKSALISWKPVLGTTHYEIKLFKEKNQAIGTFQTTEPQKLLENLTEDTFYYVEVKAINGIGAGKGYKEFFRTEQPKIAERTVNTGASIVSNYEILVKWDVDPNAFGYDIEADGEIFTVGKATEFKHKSLAPGSRHVYRIRSKSQTENGPWSAPIVLMTTKSLVTETFKNGKITESHNSIVLNWDSVPNASNYLISFNNGPFIDNGKNVFCIKSSLTPDTQYDFVVKAINPLGASVTSFVGSARTKLLPVPVITNIEEVPAGIRITWQPVVGAEYYTLKQNDTVVVAKSTETNYLVTNLKSLENISFSLMAASTKGTSAWSSAITVEGISEMPQKPQGLSACGSSDNIVVTWNTLSVIEVASQGLAYEIEIDGVVWEPLELGKYVHEGLDPFSEHTYRVRVKNVNSMSEWTEKIVVQTLPGVPNPPKNVAIRNMTYYANLTWDADPSVTGYEVGIQQADATFKTVLVGNRNFFNHKKLAPTEQVYRIRAINMIGNSEWSQLIVNNAIKAECVRGKELDLGLTMSNITDFDQYELQVTYNPAAIDVTDLCGYTSEKELKAGAIVGTDIEVVSYVPGKIVFKVKKGLKNGTAWSGVINNIKFVPKQSGGSYINYTVFIKE